MFSFPRQRVYLYIIDSTVYRCRYQPVGDDPPSAERPQFSTSFAVLAVFQRSNEVDETLRCIKRRLPYPCPSALRPICEAESAFERLVQVIDMRVTTPAPAGPVQAWRSSGVTG